MLLPFACLVAFPNVRQSLDRFFYNCLFNPCAQTTRQSLHRIRDRMVANRIQLVCQMGAMSLTLELLAR